MKNIFKRIKKIFENRLKRREYCMSTKEIKRCGRPFIDMNYNKISTIRRSGRHIIIDNGAGRMVPISYNQVKHLGNSLVDKYGVATIKTIGLSKAQVGRVAGDLQKCTSSNVYVRKIKTQESTELQPIQFEITLIGDNTNEG